MIIVTGAAGFIASCLVARLNEEGFTDLVLVDDFNKQEKIANFEGKKYSLLVDRGQFIEWLEKNSIKPFSMN
jgi:ADP-L-glycero-D-manno-heptose 6-epimerase